MVLRGYIGQQRLRDPVVSPKLLNNRVSETLLLENYLGFKWEIRIRYRRLGGLLGVGAPGSFGAGVVRGPRGRGLLDWRIGSP